MHVEIPLDVFTYPEIPLPEVWTVTQNFDTPALAPEQLETQARAAVAALAQDTRLKAGAQVAIGVGSRGLDNLPFVVRAVVAELKARGMRPFIVPAMGSHGGATVEGQTAVLHDYGITPEGVGAEIRATMEVEQVGTLEGEDAGPFAGHAIFWDKVAFAADAVLLINRIKAHTDFTGEIESGIAKMAVIGLGKRHGAENVHRNGAFGLRNLLPRIARYLARHTPLVGGIALLENEFGRTAEIHALPAAEVGRAPETALLQRARSIAPRLPFAEIDVLVVDEMGKNISGAGMDTHVIGRAHMPSIAPAEWGGPNVRLITCLDLTQPSHGNATGLGLADIVPQQLVAKIEWTTMLTNTRTSGEGGILKSRLPLTLPTREDCVRTAIGACGHSDLEQVRLVRIRNTAHTQYLEISAALLAQARSDPHLRVSATSHRLDLCQPVTSE